MDVMFYEVFEEERQSLERAMPKEIETGYTRQTIQESGHVDAPAGVICVRTQSRIPGHWGESIKAVLTRSQGYDHLKGLFELSGGRIQVGYLSDYCSRAVAEQAVMLVLCLNRKLTAQMAQLEVFNRDGLTGREVAGQKLLVVGVGFIGKEIVRLARALGMFVKGVDIEQKENSVEYVSLENGICWADAVVCAAELTPLTNGMLNGSVLSSAQKGILLVNVSRGEITPVKDLKQLLDSGHLGGLALDVYPNEQQVAKCLRFKESVCSADADDILALREYANVILTPHNAFNTREALDKKSEQTAASLKMYFEKGRFLNFIS